MDRVERIAGKEDTMELKLNWFPRTRAASLYMKKAYHSLWNKNPERIPLGILSKVSVGRRPQGLWRSSPSKKSR